MQISHLTSLIQEEAPAIKMSSFKHFRAFVQSGVLRFNPEWAEDLGIAKTIGLDYGLTVNNELVFCEVPLRYVNKSGNLTQTRPNPVIGNARLLSSADEKLKGLLKRPELIEDIRQALLPDVDNVYSFDFELIPRLSSEPLVGKANTLVFPPRQEAVVAIHRDKANQSVKRLDVKTYDIKLTNIDYVKKAK